MSNDLLLRILPFLAAHTTLTLATSSLEGTPQAAALFYAHDHASNRPLRLYVLSDPTSRHTTNLHRQSRCAATIQSDGQDWRSIQGLQLEGDLQPVQPKELPRAAHIYTQKFGFLGRLLLGGEGPLELMPLIMRCRFYRLTPDWMRWIDNRPGIGTKEVWRLPATSADRPA